MEISILLTLSLAVNNWSKCGVLLVAGPVYLYTDMNDILSYVSELPVSRMQFINCNSILSKYSPPPTYSLKINDSSSDLSQTRRKLGFT